MKVFLIILGIIVGIIVVGVLLLFAILMLWDKDSKRKDGLIKNLDDLKQLMPELQEVEAELVSEEPIRNGHGRNWEFKFTHNPETDFLLLVNKLTDEKSENCFGLGQIRIDHLHPPINYWLKFGRIIKEENGTCRYGNIYVTKVGFFFCYATAPSKTTLDAALQEIGIQLPDYSIIAADEFLYHFGTEWHDNYRVKFAENISADSLNDIFEKCKDLKWVKIYKENLVIEYGENGGSDPYTIRINFLPGTDGKISLADVIRGCLW